MIHEILIKTTRVFNDVQVKKMQKLIVGGACKKIKNNSTTWVYLTVCNIIYIYIFTCVRTERLACTRILLICVCTRSIKI